MLLSFTNNYRVNLFPPGVKKYFLKKTFKEICSFLLFTFGLFPVVNAQDLDPRAYVKVPVNANVITAGMAFQDGDVLLDPTVPIEDLEATAESLSFGFVRSFSFFGQSAQALAVLPYSWAQLSGKVEGLDKSRDLNGLSDMRLRFSVLLLGGKAITTSDMSKPPPRTIIGTSVTVIAPTGEYTSEKLINLGTNRWAIKPEIAVTQRIGNRWMMDLYTGVWLFTDNDSFYPGSSERKQDPLYSFQGHLSYNINTRTWAAFNATYYTGGQSAINDIYKDDRQSNSRLGVTLSFPVAKRNSVKIAYSQGAIIRSGGDFKTLSIGWNYTWFDKKSRIQK